MHGPIRIFRHHEPGIGVLSGHVRAWFLAAFPDGPNPAQELAWPLIAASEHVLIVSPTGTGKTLAAFLSILDRLFRAHESGQLAHWLAVRLRLSVTQPQLRHRAQSAHATGGHSAQTRS